MLLVLTCFHKKSFRIKSLFYLFQFNTNTSNDNELLFVNYLNVQKIIGIDKLTTTHLLQLLKDQPTGMDQKRWVALWLSTVLVDRLHLEWLGRHGVVLCPRSSLRPAGQPRKVQIYPVQVWGMQDQALVLLASAFPVLKGSLAEEVVAALGLAEAVALAVVGMGIL